MQKSLTCELPFSIFHRFNLKLVWLLSFIFISTLLIFYIVQVNYLAREISLIRAYGGELGQLAENNEELEIDLAKFSSLENIENFLQNRNFEKVNPSQVKYIRILESSVVTKGGR